MDLHGHGTAPRPERRVRRLAAAILAAAAAGCSAGRSPEPLPERLADTGLYSDFAARTVHPDCRPFAPQYPLWTDGAAKRRWIRLPAGASIDASDPARFEFPAGTRLWKEFAWERRIETRFMEKLEDGTWRFAAYAWTADGSDAVLAPECGVLRAHEVRPGAAHHIPSRADCRTCHAASGRAGPLGFTALQLSPDRDPNAAHAEAPPQGAQDLASLVASGSLRGLPADVLAHPPRIAAEGPVERAALGYLHANCGSCHDREGPLAALGLHLAVSLSTSGRWESPAAATSVGVSSRFRRPDHGPDPLRIRPGDASGSLLVRRMSARDPLTRMPPLGTEVADDAGLALVSAWIDQDLASRTPLAARAPETSTSLRGRKQD